MHGSMLEVYSCQSYVILVSVIPLRKLHSWIYKKPVRVIPCVNQFLSSAHVDSSLSSLDLEVNKKSPLKKQAMAGLSVLQ